MVSLRAFHAHHFSPQVLTPLCAVGKCCFTYILNFAKWTLLKNVMPSHHVIIWHPSHHHCVLKVVVKKRIAKTIAIHHAHVSVRNFSSLFLLDTLYRKIKRWFYKTLKISVVISQSLDFLLWDITELRRRKEMFESPDNLYFQCFVQSFQSGAGIIPEQQGGSVPFVCNDGWQQ